MLTVFLATFVIFLAGDIWYVTGSYREAQNASG